ncbi:hypothetical protein COW95_02790 [Candidatus Peregrinibacteria bacterium CG22_combo_CG10-13_8_21_14_all_49_11]|nr:MAG: hypothetical protein COW95_02790 [Candidatus Peregrinibacteria bacterium CG22_combo_CG10-13_8_21_14_all_49_11]
MEAGASAIECVAYSVSGPEPFFGQAHIVPTGKFVPPKKVFLIGTETSTTCLLAYTLLCGINAIAKKEQLPATFLPLPFSRAGAYYTSFL